MKGNNKYNLNILTIFFSVVLTFFTSLILLVVLTLQIGKQIEGKQEEIFNKQVSEIKKEIKKKDMDSALKKFIQKGYSIIVFDQSNNVIYPEITDSNYLFLNSEGFVASFNIGEKKVVISYPKSITSKDATSAYFRVLPAAIAVLLIVMIFVFKLYLKLLRKEMNKLKILILDIKKNKRYSKIQKKEYDIRVFELDEIATQLKAMHEQNQNKSNQLNSEIQKVNRLQSNSVSLFNSITHEMKTPLMSSNLIMERIDISTMSKKNLKLLENLKKELSFLENFTKEILFIAQRKNYSMYSYENSVHELIKKIEYNYSILLKEKKIIFDVYVKSDLKMNLDKLLIEKILSNLISNAILYSEAASTIEVTITSYSITIKNSIDSVVNNTDEVLPNKKTGLGIFLINMMLLESDYSYTAEIKNNEYIVIISKY